MELTLSLGLLHNAKNLLTAICVSNFREGVYSADLVNYKPQICADKTYWINVILLPLNTFLISLLN